MSLEQKDTTISVGPHGDVNKMVVKRAVNENNIKAAKLQVRINLRNKLLDSLKEKVHNPDLEDSRTMLLMSKIYDAIQANANDYNSIGLLEADADRVKRGPNGDDNTCTCGKYCQHIVTHGDPSV
jgi:hypothetical protein